MTKRFLLAGMLAIPGCAWDGSITLSPRCNPCHGGTPIVTRICNPPAPPPVVISQPSPSPQESGDLVPAPPLTPVEALPPEAVKPTSKWRPVAR